MTFRTLCGPAEVRGLGWVYVPSRGGQIYRAMPRMSRLFLGPVFEEYLRALPSAAASTRSLGQRYLSSGF